MPFFEGAKDFVISAAHMNDVAHDYNRNETHTTYNNQDVGNNYGSDSYYGPGSIVNTGGHMENQNFTTGGGNNTGYFGHGRRDVNGNAQPSNLPPSVQGTESFPQQMPGAQATRTAAAMGSAGPRSVGINNVTATPAPAAQTTSSLSVMLSMLGKLPEDSWTPQMRMLLLTVFELANKGV